MFEGYSTGTERGCWVGQLEVAHNTFLSWCASRVCLFALHFVVLMIPLLRAMIVLLFCFCRDILERCSVYCTILYSW